MSSRATIVEQICLQLDGQSPVSYGEPHWFLLGSGEEPYCRTIEVGQEWTSLDCGWIERASLLLITNEEGRRGRTNLSDEDRAAQASKIVEVRAGDGPKVALIHPQRDFRISPDDPKSLQLRCQNGKARIKIVLFPE